mmetsp:Transcript_2979/g.6841  ORF Transcript_2979/g.6841 Transcript_2979/m.6841 type:complete len:203 (+) Transcript_2979:385-993(+)
MFFLVERKEGVRQDVRHFHECHRGSVFGHSANAASEVPENLVAHFLLFRLRDSDHCSTRQTRIVSRAHLHRATHEVPDPLLDLWLQLEAGAIRFLPATGIPNIHRERIHIAHYRRWDLFVRCFGCCMPKLLTVAARLEEWHLARKELWVDERRLVFLCDCGGIRLLFLTSARLIAAAPAGRHRVLPLACRRKREECFRWKRL